jgi:hypothetical protein
MFLGIDLDIADYDSFCSFMRIFPSRECTDTSDKFTIITRLAEIVIGSVVESCDDIITCSTRSEHDDGSSLPFIPKTTTDLDTIHAWELDIEDDDIIGVIYSFHIAISSDRAKRTPYILIREVASDCLGECDVIFDEECVHEYDDYKRELHISKFSTSAINKAEFSHLMISSIGMNSCTRKAILAIRRARSIFFIF